MNRIIPFTVFCALIMIAFAGKQPDVVGVLDPVATYSGMTTLCEANIEMSTPLQLLTPIGVQNYFVYAIPFPRPPGYSPVYVHPGSSYGRPLSDVLIPEQSIDDEGMNKSTEHFIGANITGCEAWVSLVSREDIGVPFQGSSLTGENIDSGGNFEVDLSLAVHMDDSSTTDNYFDDFGSEDTTAYFVDGGRYVRIPSGDNVLVTADFLHGTEESPGIRYFINQTTIYTGIDPRVARIGLYSDLNPMPLNCDMLLILIPEDGIKVLGPEGSAGVINYNDNPNDDCVQVLWGVAVYYDVAVPFAGRGSVISDDRSPVSVRAILRELLAT
jgi:hypothetical protein